MDGVVLVSYDVFLVEGTCACVLVDGVLKGSVVSSSRFWGVFRFGMPLGSVLVLAVLGTSISAAASK